MKCVYALAAVIALASCEQSTPNIITRTNIGGNAQDGIDNMLQKNATGQRVEIRSPECSSACGFNLGVIDVCVNAVTQFGFHGAHGGSDASIDRVERLFTEALKVHSPELSEWYWLEGRHFVNLRYFSGRELIETYGYEECE